jgi:hypothetical protein
LKRKGKRKNKQRKTKKKSSKPNSFPEDKKPAKKKQSDEKKKPQGFHRGLEAERIIGATDSSGELMFLMKWKGTDEKNLVPSRKANVHYPPIIIQFYEEHLILHSPIHDDEGKGDAE